MAPLKVQALLARFQKSMTGPLSLYPTPYPSQEVKTGQVQMMEKARRPRSLRVGPKGSPALKISAGTVTEDFLPRLHGERGVQVFREMMMNDPVVGGMISQMELRLRSVKWTVKKNDESRATNRLAQVVERSMNGMESPWNFVMSDVVTALVFGWALFEQLYKVEPGVGVILKELAFRGQDTLYQWEFDPFTRHATTMIQRVPYTAETFFIPLKGNLHIKTNGRKSNPEGFSLLRTAYRPWWMKKNIEEIEGIGIERDMNGIPHIHFPELEFDPTLLENSDVITWAENMVSSMSKNELAGAVTFKNMTLSLLQGKNSTIDTDKIIRRYNQSIAICFHTQYMTIPYESRGTGTTAESYGDMMLDSLDAWSMIFASQLEKQMIEPLKVFNGLQNGNVSLVPSKISSKDKVEFAAWLARLISNGAIMPDDPLEAQIRRDYELPPKDAESARTVSQLYPPSLDNQKFILKQPPKVVGEPKMEEEIAKSLNDGGWFEDRDGRGVSSDGDGIVVEEGKVFAFMHKGVVISKGEFDSTEQAIGECLRLKEIGPVTVGKYEGKRGSNEVYKRLVTLF